MKSFITFFLILIGSYSIAQGCYDSFIEENGVVDSKAFSLKEEIDLDFSSQPELFVLAALREVLPKNKDCSNILSRVNPVLKSGDLKVSCAEIAPGKWHSRSCFVEMSIGYFFVSLDMLDNVHIIYNRWD